MAIVGSGPSGFYAAEALLRRRTDVQVDMFDRLPTPFGLVRGGVAPDHPKIKQVTLVYDKIARSPGFTFLGNVEIGRTVTIEQLRSAYHVVVLASGASADRRLGIAGEDLAGSHTATEFVGWYNAHPDYRDRRFDFSGECAVIIGQGNVAGDVARILATPVDDLRRTDIAEHALDALACSRIRDIYVIGRRGPAQIKFTAGRAQGARTVFAIAPPSWPATISRSARPAPPKSRMGAGTTPGRTCRCYGLLRRRQRPTASDAYGFAFSRLRCESTDRAELNSATLARNRMQGPPFDQVAIATAQTFELPCSLVLRSVGYRGVAVPGVSFDERAGIIPNHKGRCLIGDDPIPGMYVTGWIKRGPVGIIGTNRADSVETVEAIFEDLAKVRMAPKPGAAALRDALCTGGERIVSYGEWQRIDVAERGRGHARNKPREKYTLVSEMIAAIDAGAT